MRNEVWSEIGAFLNNLRCGNVDRKTYLHFPELEEAERLRKSEKVNFEAELKKLDASQRKQIEAYLETVQHQAFMEEERAYCQGYVDCIQLLAGLGMLNGNPDIDQVITKMKK
ncbi:MAG: hypothetical protein Q4F41_15550 [Eubacteriales bacterium]|nr:hypothetical protein [Eubacteriales bacterium]